jgi:hypothetical protein
MTAPNPHISDVLAVNLVSDGIYRYAAWYSVDGATAYFGRQALAGGAWTIHTFAGADATTLDLPVPDDDHNFPAVALLGDGKAVVLANMHGEELKALVSDNAVASDITEWTALSLTGIGTRVTYPIPVHRPDGSTRLYFREGGALTGSARSDSAFWETAADGSTYGTKTTIFQGLEVPNAKGAGVAGDDASTDTEFNWCAYPTVPVVTDAGGGEFIEHWAWCWRNRDSGVNPDRTNVLPSYMQYRSATDSWHAIDGTEVTLPVDPVNTLAVQTGLTAAAEGYLNWGGLAIDGDGFPHMMVSRNPHYHQWWDGAAWQQDSYGSAGGWTLGGVTVLGRLNCVWLRGALWIMTAGGPTDDRRPRLWRLDGTGSVCLGGTIPGGGTWEFYLDPVRWRDGVVDVFTPDGATPRVVSFGDNVRMVAA